jgi:hypothetical protein
MTIAQLRAALDEIERRIPDAVIECSEPYISIVAQDRADPPAYYASIDDDGTVHWDHEHRPEGQTMGRTFALRLDTGYSGATHEDEVTIEDGEYETEEELERILGECIETMISNHIDGYWEEIK